jgi:tellurium resistance protein TerD
MPEHSSNTEFRKRRKGIKVGIDFEQNKSSEALQFNFMALMLDNQGKLVSDNHFIFYNNLKSPDGSVEHLGNVVLDSKDYEQIIVDTSKVDKLVSKIIFFVSIHNAEQTKQRFEQINKLRIKFTSLETGEEIAEYQPEKDNSFNKSNLIVLAELVLINDEWQIDAMGDSYRVKLAEFIDIISKDYSYESFKDNYFKNYIENENNDGSVRNFIDKDLEEHYYKILECSKDSTDEQIRKKYKELVKSFHPDVIMSKNLHNDIVEFARNRFKEIKIAYDFIKAKRNFH